MLILFIHFLATQTQVQGWVCGGDRTFIEEIPHHRRHLLTRSTTLAPIRISFYYYNFDLGSAEHNEYFNNTVMPAVNSFLTTTLKVYPVQGKLKTSANTCVDAVVPNEHKTDGVDADMIIYVTVDNLSDVDYIAYAGACDIQPDGLNNVVAGGITINIPNFVGSGFGNSFAAVTHEITHVLAFSDGLYSLWKTSSGAAYAANTLTKSVTIRGVTKTLIVTPNVVAKAREAFGCSTLEGVELEEYGGPGTAGAHWDRRIMMNDYMIGVLSEEPIWSTITLALLQDSGWYTVDYTLAVVPTFGKVQGCDFFYEKCYSNSVAADSRVWCDTYFEITCDHFALTKGRCLIGNWPTALPSYFQYYWSSTIGGYDPFTDYCPYRMPYNDGNCRDTSGVTYVHPFSSEVTGLKSRCFESTLIQNTQNIYTLSAPYSACYEVISCSSTSATVKIGSQTLVCPFTGGTFTVEGYLGTIKCPASSILCDDVHCINMCYGHGTCSKGLCQCFSGYGGDDCSIVCSPGCSSCTSSTSCTTCNTGYSLVNDSCAIICPSNCQACSSSTTCTTCNAGYYLLSESCSLCPTSCSACSSSTTCTTCKSGYYLSSGSCPICPTECSECTSSTACTACKTDYILVSGSCVIICPSNCQTCLSSTTCTTCNSGYYLSSGSCAQCPLECSTCASSIVCTTCKTGYSLSSGTCVIICPSNCQTCSSATACTTCNSGYYLSLENCDICPTECSECTSLSTCTACKTGYSLSSGICVIICPSGCQTCSSGTACTACNPGHYLSSGNCVLCPIECSECSSSTTCTACKTGSSLVSGTCVIICPSNCQACSSSTTCTICDSGYYSSSGSCVLCEKSCSACISSTTCTACKTGYSLSSGVCVITCPANCETCSSSKTCTKCNSGYYLLSGSCAICPIGCLVCSSIRTCTSCETGYRLSSNKCIMICPSNCQTCISSTVCAICKSGYYLSTESCSKCSSGCDSCISSASCLICSTGYYLSDTSCAKCPSNCLICSSSAGCTTCKSGYFLSNEACINCSTGCSVCTSSTTCFSCLAGYRLSSSACIACKRNCLACTSTACTICKRGYVLILGKCL